MLFTATTKAKLNLSLNIVGKRDDGYHLLRSVVVFCDIGDEVHIRPSKGLSLRCEGVYAASLVGDEHHNLVLRAARALQEYTHTDKGADITLYKHLPLASGIGGGSGDAAATLRLLNELWSCKLNDAQLAEIGVSLGADIPVCLYQRACVMEGIGERITPLPALPEQYYTVLINPHITIPTANVFAKVKRYREDMLPLIQAANDDWSQHLSQMTNDLEMIVVEEYPVIAELIDVLTHYHHTVKAGMSGSGATCYAIIRGTSQEAKQLKRNLLHAYPDMWVEYGTLH